jgi:predicted NBD/HSP70 family sugar kinase
MKGPASGVHKPSLPLYSLANQQAASNHTPRRINRNLIFNQIRIRQPISRAELARISGLQRSTVSLVVDELLADSWIVESAAAMPGRGRPPMSLTVNVQRSVLAMDVHPARITLAVVDLGGTVMDPEVLEFDEASPAVLRALVSVTRKMIARRSDLFFGGVGIGLPGRLTSAPYSATKSKAIFAPNVAWPIETIHSRIQKATGLPVVADNVANACALSAVWFGDSDASRDLVVVNVSEGIGTGIFANGGLLRGEGGSAGEFGHVQMDPNGLPCGCGSRGCWETIASNRAALRYYQEASGKAVPSYERLLELTRGGDADAKAALNRQCEEIGRGLHMISNALSPAEIVVVGDITANWEIAGSILQQSMIRKPTIHAPRIRPAIEGTKARLRSAVALVMEGKHL